MKNRLISRLLKASFVLSLTMALLAWSFWGTIMQERALVKAQALGDQATTEIEHLRTTVLQLTVARHSETHSPKSPPVSVADVSQSLTNLHRLLKSEPKLDAFLPDIQRESDRFIRTAETSPRAPQSIDSVASLERLYQSLARLQQAVNTFSTQRTRLRDESKHTSVTLASFVCALLLIGLCLLLLEAHKDRSWRKIWVLLVRRQRRRLHGETADLKRANERLSAMNARLAALATTDGLTGLKNHRAFTERLTEEVQRATRYNTRLSVMMVDVDRFKQVNDTLGHQAGDAVLRTIAHILQTNARRTDIVARYGGEEFGIILPETDSDAATEVAERLRLAVEHHPWEERPITVSIGVAAMKPATHDPSHLVQEADEALYTSKRSGRNRVTRYASSDIVTD